MADVRDIALTPDSPGCRVLGFQARRRRPDPRGWSDEQRKLYLLREDVSDVLTADTNIWGRADLSCSSEPAGLMGLAFDLDALSRCAPSGPDEFKEIIAVAWVAPGSSEAPRVLADWPWVEVRPPVPEGAWIFLGYDVVDDGWISGLSDCGYRAPERARLSSEFAASINEHHLLIDPQTAVRFSTMTDFRVPEHAPFFPVGLFSVG